MSAKLFVGSLAFSITDQDLSEAFAEAGTVESAKVIMDRDTNRSKGFGFVEMSSEDEAKQAIKLLNGREVNGRQINVDLAKPMTDRPARPAYDRRPRY